MYVGASEVVWEVVDRPCPTHKDIRTPAREQQPHAQRKLDQPRELSWDLRGGHVQLLGVARKGAEQCPTTRLNGLPPSRASRRIWGRTGYEAEALSAGLWATAVCAYA